MFKTDLCDFCGDCLVECQWIDVARDQAVEWMKTMAEGNLSPMLNQCITCYACNEVCPQRANPFDLIADLQERFGTFITQEAAVAEEVKYVFSGELKDAPLGERVMTTCVFAKTDPGLMQGQLYNLHDDLGETNNLFLERPDIVKRLQNELEKICFDGRSRSGAISR